MEFFTKSHLSWSITSLVVGPILSTTPRHPFLLSDKMNETDRHVVANLYKTHVWAAKKIILFYLQFEALKLP